MKKILINEVTAGQYERLHGVLAMQLAPILLGEAGKTISDADRVRVAQALGYEAQLINNNAVINLTGGAPKLFQSEADAKTVSCVNSKRS